MTYPYSRDIVGKTIVTLDLETYYDRDYSVRKLDYLDYVTDDRFEMIIASLRINDEPTQHLHEAELREALAAIDLTRPDVVTVAHNARFEATYLAQRLGIVPNEIMCTMCMARASGVSRVFGGGLEELSQAVLGGEKNIAPMMEALPYITGEGLRDDLRENIAAHAAKVITTGGSLSSPAIIQIYSEITGCTTFRNNATARSWARRKVKTVVDYALGKRWEDMDADMRLLYTIYVKADTDATKELYNEFVHQVSHREARMIHYTMLAYVRPLMTIDPVVAEKALEEEIARVEAIVETSRLNGFDMMSHDNFRRFVRTRVEAPYTVACMLGLDMPPLDDDVRKNMGQVIFDAIQAHNRGSHKKIPEFVEIRNGKYSMVMSKDGILNDYILDNFPRGHYVRDFWEAKLSLASTIEVSRLKRFMTKGERYDVHPAPLEYGSAHTLRFGGADKMNFQNLGGASPLRAAVQARPGRILVATDSAQIEPRLQGVICNDLELLRVFQAGDDVYIHTAASIFGEPYEKMMELKNTDPTRFSTVRDIGKVARLSLGYSMGGQTFGRRGELWGIPFADTTEAHYEEAVRITRAFRRGNPAITAMWGKLENAFAGAIDGYNTYLGGPDDRLIHIYPTNYYGTKVVVMELPGVRMLYPRLAWVYDEEREREQMTYYRNQGKGRVMPESLYGGKALENVTQALAACVIKEQGITVAEHFGYPFLFNVHDENITECAVNEGLQVASNTIEVMGVPPIWAPHLPLGAEALLGKSFMGSYEYTKKGGLEEISHKKSEIRYGVVI